MGNRCADVVPAHAEGPRALPATLQAQHEHLGAHPEAGDDALDDAVSQHSDEDQEDQDHAFAFAGELSEEELAALDDQFRSVLDDRARWAQIFQQAKMEHEDGEPDVEWLPPQTILWTRKKTPKIPIGASVTAAMEAHEAVVHSWQASGYDMLGSNKVAAVVLAGRDDTGRFGKKASCLGMSDVGLLSKKAPFQLLCERLLRVQSLVDSRKRGIKHFLKAKETGGVKNVDRKRLKILYGQEKLRSLDQPCYIPLFVMTSASSLHQVRSFFDLHSNFGLEKSQVVVFPQAENPVFDLKGKVKLASKSCIMTHPGGSGELFRAMQDQAVLADLKSHDIEFVWVGAVDNLISKIVDPKFIGFCQSSRVDIAVKLVDRPFVDEELGLFLQCWDESGASKSSGAEAERKARVLEYSHLTWEVKNMRIGTGDAGLLYRHANTCEFVFSMSALDDICQRNDIKHHWVPLSRPYVDWRRGGILRSPPPSQKASIHLQTFLGDCLPAVPRVGGFLVQRWCEFAPMKALEGRHSITAAIWTLSTTHQRWILNAGGSGFAGFWDNSVADESLGRLCEVSPLVSYEGEGLGGAFVQGTKLDLPLHLEARRGALDSASPRLQDFDMEEIALAQSEPTLKYVAEESVVAAQEVRLQQEARQRASVAAIGEGRPLTGGEFAAVESGERLPATPQGGDDSVVKATEARKRAKRMANDQQSELGEWQTSQAVQDALRQVTRFPQLDRLDEEKLNERMKKASSMGDSMSEAAMRMGSKTGGFGSRMGSKASPGSRMASKTSPAASRMGSKASPGSRAGSKQSPSPPGSRRASKV